MNFNVAKNKNTLAKFLGTRDIDELNQEELFKRYGIHQVDVMVLFGGSILAGGDVRRKIFISGQLSLKRLENLLAQ